ncbi:MAG: hypothetical protein IPG03_14065 [Candidatus Microthrix sp.]|nr:hypothetical protein [Candidatus Microthrix sp.]MBK6503424.1 hypothetical protein [Candidatus Microthrix sp.]
MNKHSPQSVAIALAMAVALGGAATGCGSDSETKDASATTSQTAETTTTTGASSNKPGEVTVVASDYMFEGLPKSVPAGTKLVMENQSKKELHEMVVVRFPDDEKRSIDEIAKLPEAEVDAIFGGGPPETVQLQAPGGELINAVGDGTLAKAGRYAIACFIPVGVDPAEYLKASEASPGGPPSIPNAGPPHFVKGMYAEVTVD